MGDVILSTGFDTSGLKAGSQEIVSAVKSLGAQVGQSAKSLTSAVMGMSKNFVRRVGAMFGMVGILGALTKATQTYLASNQELSGQLSGIWGALGNLLGPIINNIVNLIVTAMSYFMAFLKLLGVASAGTKAAAKGAGGAAAALQKQLMGFDEINKMADDNGGGGGGGGPKDLKDLELPDWAKILAELLKQGMWDEAGQLIANKLNELVNNAPWEEMGEKFAYYFNGVISVLASVLDHFDWKNLGAKLASMVNKVLEGVNWNNLGRLLAAKISILIQTVAGFIEHLDASALATAASDIIIGFFEEIDKAIQSINAEQIGNQIRTFFTSIKWGEIIEVLVQTAQDLVSQFFTALLAAFGQNERIKEIQDKVAGLFDALRNLGSAISEAFDLGDFDFGIVVDILSTVLTILTDIVNFFAEHPDLLGPLVVGLAALSMIKIDAGIASNVGGIGDAMSKVGGVIGGFIGDLGAAISLFNEGGSAVEVFGAAFPKLAGVISAVLSPLGLLVVGIGAAIAMAHGQTSALTGAGEALRGTYSTYEEASAAVQTLTADQEKYRAVLADTASTDAEIEEATKNLIRVNSELAVATEEAARLQAEEAAAAGDAAGEVSAATDEIAESVETVGQKVTEVKETTVAEQQEIQAAVAETQEAVNTAQVEITETLDQIKQAVSETSIEARQLDAIKEKIATTLSSIVENINQTFSDIQNTVTQFLTQINSDVESNMSQVESTIGDKLTNVASQANTWGYDVGKNLAAGMNSSAGLVAAAAQNLASIISSYLHFSEPDKGPLSNFHTFMPDMIDLMVDGIDGNKNKVAEAAEGVANDIADAVQGEDYKIDMVADGVEGSMDGFADKIVDGFDNLISRLEAIAERVTFSVPEVAKGTVVPYSVSGGAMSDKGTLNSDSQPVSTTDIDRLIEAQQQSSYSMLQTIVRAIEGIDMDVTLDGMSLARKMYRYNQKADNEHGTQLVNVYSK